MADLWFVSVASTDEETCPVHGHTLAYADPQPEDFDLACLLECIVLGCNYKVREDGRPA